MLTILVGILGTIIGFYFGANIKEEAPAKQVSPPAAASEPESST